VSGASGGVRPVPLGSGGGVFFWGVFQLLALGKRGRLPPPPPLSAALGFPLQQTQTDNIIQQSQRVHPASPVSRLLRLLRPQSPRAPTVLQDATSRPRDKIRARGAQRGRGVIP